MVLSPIKNVIILSITSLSSFLSFSTVSHAANFFFDFESPLPDSVVAAGVTSNGVVPFLPTIEMFNDNNILRLSNEPSAAQGGFATSFFGNQAVTFSDVKVSALLNPTRDSNDQVAVLARANLLTLDTYTASIDFSENRLILSKAIGGEVTVLADAFDILPSLNQAYFVELEVIGNQLTGRFFDANRDNELFTLQTTDTDNPLLSGISGLGVDISETAFPGFDDPNNSTFDNFSSMSITVPEPNTLLGLLPLSGLLLLTTKSSNKES